VAGGLQGAGRAALDAGAMVQSGGAAAAAAAREGPSGLAGAEGSCAVAEARRQSARGRRHSSSSSNNACTLLQSVWSSLLNDRLHQCKQLQWLPKNITTWRRPHEMRAPATPCPGAAGRRSR
jgi:hypothetical protein